MKLLKAIKSIILDTVVCGLIIIPLFVNVGMYLWLSKMAVTLCFVLCWISGIAVIVLINARNDGKWAFTLDELKKYDCFWYRVYSPISDFAIACCLALVGNYILGAFWMLVNMCRRDLIEKEIEEHLQGKRKRYAGKSNKR